MYYLLDKKSDQTLSINFIGTEQFNVGDKLTLYMTEPIKGITSITSYNDNIIGETSSTYLKKFYQYKIGNAVEWSEMLPIESITSIPNFLTVCKKKSFELRLLYFRMDDGGPNNSVVLSLSNISINGTFEYTSSDTQITLKPSSNTQIFEISDVLKIFRIDNYEIISSAKLNSSYTVKYRYSQDNKRTWSNWERLTLANISTAKIDKLRFVNLQYLFELNPGITSTVKIYDVVLYGDIQNVSANYLKMNKLGLKENCINLYSKSASVTTETSGINNNITEANGGDSTTQSLVKVNSEYQLHMNFLTQGLACYNSPNGDPNAILNSMNMQNQANSATQWNPYDTSKTVEWYNYLANTINSMLGFTIDYHRTDPDGKGIDKVMFEYQLFNIVDMKQIKVLVPENNFPDNSVVINQFNLDLFDTFKIAIMKDEFKKAFGVEFRPGKEDIIYFCQTNRMYIVKHAQIHKDVMNAGVYYDVVLEKYEKRANVLNRVEESKNKIEELTRNTTIDDLFGFEQKEQQDQISNKIQTKPKSFDYIRNNTHPKLNYYRKKIFNGMDSLMFESFYLLNDVPATENAIVYNITDNKVVSSDVRSFSFWFNIPNQYDKDSAITKRVFESYYPKDGLMFNLMDNMSVDGLGYKIWYQNNKIWFMINDKIFTLEYKLLTNMWNILIINFNQRNGEVSMKIYRRNTTIDVLLCHPKTYELITLDYDTEQSDIQYEINTNGFKPIDNNEKIVSTQDSDFVMMNSIKYTFNETYEFTHTDTLKIKGSNMYLTNIRILDDLILDGEEQIFLNQTIVKNEQNVILADNGEKQIKTTNIPNKNWR